MHPLRSSVRLAPPGRGGARRRWPAVAAALAAAGPLSAPAAGAHVLLPDPADSYPVIRHPVDVAVSPDGAMAAVVFREASDLALVDLSSGDFVNVPAAAYGGDHPVRAAFAGNRLLVANLYSPFVTEVDPAAAAVVAQHPVPEYCTDILVDEPANRIYLANRWRDEVLVYDLAMNAVASAPGLPAGQNPARLALDADGLLYVGNEASWDVTIVDPSTGAIVHTVYLGSGATGMARVGDHVLVTSHGGDTLPTVNGAPMIMDDQVDIVNVVTWIHRGDFGVQHRWVDLGADYMDLQAGHGLVAFTGAGGGTVHVWRETDPVGDVQTLDLLAPQWGLPGGNAPSGLRIFSNTRAVAIVGPTSLVAANYFRDSLVRVTWDAGTGAFRVGEEIALNEAGDPITALQPTGTNMTTRQSGERYMNTLAAWRRDQKDFTCATCHVDGHTDHRFIFDQDPDPHAPSRQQGPERHPTVQGGALTAPYGWEGSAPSLGEFNLLAQDAHDVQNGSTEVHGDVAFDFLPLFEAALLPDPSPYEPPSYDPLAQNAAEHGRQLFFGRAECGACHGGPAFMDNSLHEVGTGRFLVTPTLLGLWDRRPLLHDGRAETVADVLDPALYDPPGGVVLEHGKLTGLTAAERNDLVAFLLAIEWGTRQDGILEPGPGPAPAPSGLQLTAGPNPAPGDVRFLYALPVAGRARLAIYDVTGQLVTTLLEGTASARGEIVWDRRTAGGRQVVAGMYWADLASAGGRVTRKVVLMR